MLDIKYIRDNAQAIQKAARQKKIDLDVNQLLKIDKKRRELQTQINQLEKQKNQLSAKIKGKPTVQQIKQGKTIKQRINQLDQKFEQVKNQYQDLMVLVPIVPSKDTPIGKDESENVEIYRQGDIPKFDFPSKDYLEIAKTHDLLDLERGVKVSGYRGYYIKNQAVPLVLGMMMHALNKLIAKGFTPIIPPTLVREFVLYGSGYFAGSSYNPKADNIYQLANQEIKADGSQDKQKNFLVGTAEPSLLAYHANETLEEKDLPLKFCGFSQCYRSEIGSYGKDTKGIYRVHEFLKVEQVCLSRASIQESDQLHQEMLGVSKELHQDLEIPFRQIQICTGDLSAGKYKQFDMEAWIPSRQDWGETGSASNFLDWQSRRLNVKYKDKKGQKKYVYMLNNTALASTRPLIAILENLQLQDGSVRIPKALQSYLKTKTISKK
ncbi:MAG: serine--tRNA ligase [Candidatus Moranbacteria bacterium]|nr:serine--tRNA ligase [Candidatus Moranbacteria bacterium]